MAYVKLRTTDGHTPCESPPAPPGLLPTPQSYWQPYSMQIRHRALWFSVTMVFKQSDESAAVNPVALEPLDEQAPSKPNVLEVVHAVQYGITPKRPPLPCSDAEILSGIDEDVSSIRDGFTALGDAPIHLLRLSGHCGEQKKCRTHLPRGLRKKTFFSPTKIPVRQHCAKPFT